MTARPALVALLSLAASARADDRPPIDLARDVRPILAAHCLSCHGPDQQKSGLRLDGRAALLAGGESGPAVVPGHADDSPLIDRVTADDPTIAMPPKGKRLSAAEVDRLRAWINAGAPWPDEAGPTHWAFRPVGRPALPAVSHPEWVRNPIDSLVMAKLESEDVEPSPEADRPTLIRRLSLDLLGLSPEPAEVTAFLDDDRPDAYERLVDRLLASPHLGERWGRHWLDLARYADSDGYEKDQARPYAYRYRDWVIDAINRDLPFDRFTIEQLAGDLLPDATIDQKAATGFHRNTLTNHEGGVDPEEFRVAAVVDRVNTTGTVWLGLTVGCAQCHSHKFDPISQAEYYRLFAFFNGSREVDLPAPLPGEAEAYADARAKHDAEHDRLLEVLFGPERPDDPEWQRLRNRVYLHEKLAPKPSTAVVPTLAERPEPPTTHILIRGDFLRPGEVVSSGTPVVLPALDPGGPAADRLDLARWLFDPAQPLTGRVAINRIWAHLFGRPLVATPDDLGTRGELPSHPELLDWLAAEYRALGWSRKALVRRIVTSATYRQSSRLRPNLMDRDPNNVWLARQGRFRVEAEVVRDLALSVSGLRRDRVGGPSVRPPQPAGIAELTYANSVKWVESQGDDRYRRGLYTWFQRTSPYPMLITFDSPDGNVCNARRERSNTPLQALTLLNDAAFVECARAFGQRIARESSGVEGRLRSAFRLALTREPDDAELAALRRLWAGLQQAADADPVAIRTLAGPVDPGVTPAEAAAWVGLARAILNLDEFVTRE